MRRLIIAVVGLALVVANPTAAACTGDEEPPASTLTPEIEVPLAAPTEESIPGGWTSHSGEGWSIGLPASWEEYPLEKRSVSDLEEIDHPLLDELGTDLGGVESLLAAVDPLSPTLSLVMGKVPGGKPTESVEEGLDQIEEIDQQAGIAIISRTDRGKAGPYDAGTIHVHDPATAAYQFKYLVRVPDWAWVWIVFTFHFPEEEFDRALFQQIVDSFRVSR